VEELIKLNPRYELQLEVLKQEYGIKLLEVYPRGEIKPYAVWQSCQRSKIYRCKSQGYSKAGKYYQ
jgi:hypothetical protein